MGRQRFKQYSVLLSNGSVLRIVSKDFRSAYNRADKFAKAQKSNVKVAEVNEVENV